MESSEAPSDLRGPFRPYLRVPQGASERTICLMRGKATGVVSQSEPFTFTSTIAVAITSTTALTSSSQLSEALLRLNSMRHTSPSRFSRKDNRANALGAKKMPRSGPL